MGISGVSFDKIDGAMLLQFETQPAANPTPEKERAAKLVDPGFGRIFTPFWLHVGSVLGVFWGPLRKVKIELSLKAAASFSLSQGV